MTNPPRTDPHRPSAIVPADYQYILSYNLPTEHLGFPVPSFAVDCVARPDGKHGIGDRCCIARLRDAGHKFAANGGVGRCSVCSAHYIHGDVWQHTPTGEMVHLGHDCADKYSLLADRSAAELALGREKDAIARLIQTKVNAEERAAFLTNHAGLKEALETNHPIVADIARRFQQYRALTDRQIALVFKLAVEAKAPPKPEEKKVAAPTGRQTFHCKVVAIKSYQDRYAFGRTVSKMTVKVETPEGVWLAWGSLPTIKNPDFTGDYTVASPILAINVGDEYEMTATLQPGKDPHFAFFKRPKAKLLKEVLA